MQCKPGVKEKDLVSFISFKNLLRFSLNWEFLGRHYGSILRFLPTGTVKSAMPDFGTWYGMV